MLVERADTLETLPAREVSNYPENLETKIFANAGNVCFYAVWIADDTGENDLKEAAS
jgi:hypothetical protein